MMGSGPTPSLRDYFALATLVLAFLILLPLGKGRGGQLVADVYICKEDYAGFIQKGSQMCWDLGACVGALCHTAVALQLSSGNLRRSRLMSFTP